MTYSIVQRNADGSVLFEKYENITNSQLVVIFEHQDKMQELEEADQREIEQIKEYTTIEILMQDPFIKCFESKPELVKMFELYDIEQKTIIYNYFIEAECYRAASEIDQIIRNGKSQE